MESFNLRNCKRGFFALAVAIPSMAGATNWNNDHFTLGGGFNKKATESFFATPSSFDVDLANATLTSSSSGTSLWDFDFNTTPDQPLTGFTVEIDGTITGPKPHGATISLTSLDVYNTGMPGDPIAFDLSKHGGTLSTIIQGSGAFSITFPFPSSDFPVTGNTLTQGEFSIGDSFHVSGGDTLTITHIKVKQEAVPEPASFLALGLPVLGLIYKKRKA
jgi:hypothetical protein